MNQFIVTGILMTAIRSGKAKNGDAYLQFLLKCPRSYSRKHQENDDYDVFDCYIYNEGRMKWAQEHLVKNQRILLKGEMRTGKKRQKSFVLVEHIEFAGSSKYKEDVLIKNDVIKTSLVEPTSYGVSYTEETCIKAGDDKELPF